MSERRERRWTGQGHELWTYRFVNDVPLRASLDALKVNWCEVTIVRDGTGELIYRNTFATNHRLTDQNVAALVAAGRARWNSRSSPSRRRAASTNPRPRRHPRQASGR